MFVFILTVFTAITFSCRTMISPGTTHPPRTLAEMDKSVEKDDDKETMLMHPFPEKLTNKQKEELEDRYLQHNNPINGIDFVIGEDYKCKSKLICPPEDGVWACYCKVEEIKP